MSTCVRAPRFACIAVAYIVVGGAGASSPSARRRLSRLLSSPCVAGARHSPELPLLTPSPILAVGAPSLGDALLTQIGRGLPVGTACDLARASSDTGRTEDALKGFGGSGLQPSHQERDLHRWSRAVHPVKVDPYMLRLEIKRPHPGPAGEHTAQLQLPCIMPHELLHVLHEHGCMEALMCPGGTSTLDDFWQNASKFEWGLVHPQLPDSARLLPVIWHNDGVEVHKNQEHIVFSWGSLLGTSTHVLDRKFLLTSLPYKHVRDRAWRTSAFSEIARFVAWLHEVLSSGIMPATGFYNEELTGQRAEWAGRPVAGPWRFAFVGCKGDGKARVETHQFRRNYNSTYICEACLATQAFPRAPTALLYTDFSDNALYRQTLIQHDDYLSGEATLSAWCVVPGFRLETVWHDLMHVVFLGTARDSVASCIVSIACGLPMPFETALAHLHGQACTWCSRRGVASPLPFTPSSLNRTSGQSFPELSSAFKAMSVKHLIFWCAELSAQHAHIGDLSSCMRHLAMASLADFHRTLDRSALFVSLDAANAAERSCVEHLRAVQWLAAQSDAELTQLWGLRPKCHYLWHLATGLRATGLNPAALSCDMDETFMGTLRGFGRTTRGASMSLRVLQRYLLALRRRLSDHHGVCAF